MRTPEGAAALIAVPADTHSGSKFACPWGPEPWPHDGEAFYHPYKAQLILWGHWIDCWQFVADLRKRSRARLIVVHNGDAVEGDHFKPHAIHARAPGEQARMHGQMLRCGLETAGFNPRRDKLLYVDGTAPAHGGEGGDDEETAARSALHDELPGRVLTPHLLAHVNGVLFDIAHSGMRDSLNPWLFGNGIRNGLQRMYYNARDYGFAMPRYVVRSHRHIPGAGDIRDRATGQIVSEGFITGAWKLPDDHVRGFDPAGFGRIGMLVFEIAADGASRFHALYMTVQQDEVVVL